MMKPKYLIILIVINVITLKLYCQNLISNAGFEQGNWHNSIIGTQDLNGANFDDYLDSWKCQWAGTCSESWHSPDWYKGDNNALSGDAYVGMFDYELMQQKLLTGNELQNDKYYDVKLWINIRKIYKNVTVGKNNSYLKFYIAKKRVNYIQENSTGNCDEYCSEDYKNHENGILQDIKQIGSPIDLANYDEEQWVEIKFKFQTPSDADGWFVNDYNWFVMETVNKENYGSDCKASGIFIDDISIEESSFCNSDPCSPTDGLIANTPFYPVYGIDKTTRCLTGIENVREINNLRLTNSSGYVTFANYPNVYSLNGITNPVCINIPQPLAQGYYYLDAFLVNDCGTEHRVWQVSNFGLSHTNLPYYPPYNNSINTPLPCCSSQPVIHIDNKTITDPGNVEFIAQDAIYANNVTITDDVDYVHFQAGNNIELTNFTSGDNFVAEIVSCSPQSNYRMLQNPVDTNNNTPDNFISADVKQINNPIVYSEKTSTNNKINQNNSLQRINSNSKLDNPVFVIQPNPNNGKFKIGINDFSSTNFKVQIRDVLGKTIYYNVMSQNSSIIDIASSPAGIYFITVCVGKDCWFDKIIKE